jgi:hypothetical protein
MMDWYEVEFEHLSREVVLETCFVEARFGLTHIVSAGDASAPPLVMIQGLGGNAMMLHPQYALRTLADGHPVCPGLSVQRRAQL